MNPCLGNNATKRYVKKRDPTVEMYYLDVSDGWQQRLSGAGLLAFTDQCKKDGRTFRIVDPVKLHINDKIV